MTTTLRLMSYNVRSLRDDAAAVGRVMRAAAPDVVVVQEAPRFLRWRTHAASIARRAGLVVVTGGRPAAGNLLLAGLRAEVEHAEDVLLSPVPKLHQRGVAVARLRIGDARLTVAGTHLDLREDARLRHVAELRATLERVADGSPVVLGGDLNDRPGSAVFAALGAVGVDAWAAVGDGDGFTFRATAPDRRIDALFLGEGVRPTSARVVDHPDVTSASDHRPLVVDVELT